MEKRGVRAKTQTSRAGTWSSQGFTLIELSLVLVVVGLMLAFALPRLGDLGEARLRGAARHLATFLEASYDRAILQRQQQMVVLDLTRNTYTLLEPGPGSESWDPETWVPVREFSLPRGVRFLDVACELDGRVTEGVARVRFFPEARADRLVIHMGRRGKQYTLLLQVFTGRVRVEKGYHVPEDLWT